MIVVDDAAVGADGNIDARFAEIFVARGGDGVLVLGSATSSNTRRLAEIAEMGGARVWRVATDAELSGCDFTGIGTLGVTSGASTPEAFLERIRGELSRRFAALSG